MARAEERLYFDRPVSRDVGASRPPSPRDGYRDTILRIRDEILGMERRLERDEREGLDTTLGRLSVTRDYADFARRSVERLGGSVTHMRTLTNRDNMAPLRWVDGDCRDLD